MYNTRYHYCFIIIISSPGIFFISSLKGVVSTEEPLSLYVHFKAFSHWSDIIIAIAQLL